MNFTRKNIVSLAIFTVILSSISLAVAKPQVDVSTTSKLVKNLEAGEKQTLVTFGTSLTAVGAWVDQLREVIDQQYPGQAKVVNGAQGGANSAWGKKSLDEKVLKHKPDTVIIEFSVNDAVASRKTSVDTAKDNLENMIARILKANPSCEIILMTMNPPVGATAKRRPNLSEYNQMYRDVAKARGFQLIDHQVAWNKLLNEDPLKFLFYVPDTIHPVRAGALEVITPTMTESLGLKPGKPEMNDSAPCWKYMSRSMRGKDKKRVITRKDFDAFWTGIFNKNDQDKDGQLSADEFKPEVLHKALDVDGNNKVDLNEFLKVYEPHFKRFK